ncbi:hypothetical protein BGZ58_004836, partial [Dissophora ornata]
KDVPTSIPYLISWKPETTENQGDASTDNEAVKAVNGVNATALVAVVGAPLNLIAAINQAEQDRDRKGELVKKISTPCGLEVMEQARKALVRLQGFQSKRFNATANTAPSIRGSRMLDSAFDQYRQDLVYDEINSISMVSMEQSCCRRTRQVLVPEEHIVACCNGKVFSQTQHQGRHLVDVTLSIQEHPKELLCRHEKSDIFKQYDWKAPKQNTESTNDPSSTKADPSTSPNVVATNPPSKKKRKSTPKKDQLTANEMIKIQLIRSMHKIRHAVTTCLSDIPNLASKSKRVCQQALGQYLESLSVDHLDENDRVILSYLTPHFSVQEIAAAKKGTTPSPED